MTGAKGAGWSSVASGRLPPPGNPMEAPMMMTPVAYAARPPAGRTDANEGDGAGK